MNSLVSAVLYALQTIRTHFFHTVLSVLGIIIGVAALITMISMIDGLEQYAHQQIEKTTSLNVVEVSTVRSVMREGVSITKEQPVRLTKELVSSMLSVIPVEVNPYLVSTGGREIVTQTGKMPAVVHYGSEGFMRHYPIVAGTPLDETEEASVLINTRLATSLVDVEKMDEVLGNSVEVEGKTYRIKGVTEDKRSAAEVLIPIEELFRAKNNMHYPTLIIEAKVVTDVPIIQQSLQKWLVDASYSFDDIRIATQGFRIEQATKGFQLFRLIMGLIVGISIVVGGVGVMNVLLISVTQRTAEIGLRKAVGSRNKDIYRQFLSEAVIISLFGTFIGILLGMLASIILSPIIKYILDVSFPPAFTITSIGFIMLFSMIIGILFGLFPALKASRLTPIEALRRE